MELFKSREEVLRAIVDVDADSIAIALAEIHRFGEDLSTQPFVLRFQAVVKALSLLDEGKISPETLEEWAEVLHTRDDVVLDSAEEELLAEALVELSTPELFGPAHEVGADLVARRQDRSPGHDR